MTSPPKTNKYPKPKKCPFCGKRISDGYECKSNKCRNIEMNTEKKQFVPKHKTDW
jgi:predicted nucleic acid-binding Zn ribbon protein